nr:hypothetical protein [uncultured Desulfobulbus sp.]
MTWKEKRIGSSMGTLLKNAEDKRFLLGIVITLLWIATGGGLLLYRFPDIARFRLDEWSNILAGYCAPVAFLWLVLGYRQQGEELKTNTQALLAQRDEQERSVKIAAYTALMQHEEREMVLFDSLGSGYKKAALNARNRANDYAEKLKRLVEE